MTDDQPIPQWCIDRAKAMADARGDDYWLPYLRVVALENESMYGVRFPEQDPAAEARRQQAAECQRVLAPERLVEYGTEGER